MKDSQPIRIPCTGSALLPENQQLTYPVDVGVLFDGQEVHIVCPLALNRNCIAANSGINPCTTGDSIREAHAQYLSL